MDWDKKASGKEIAACRKAFTAACLKPVPCLEGMEGLEICVKNMCDPIPTEVRNHDGSIVTAYLFSWEGDSGGMVEKGEIQPLIWIGGKNETGINMTCGLQYEAQAIIKHFARRAGAQQPDVTTASASSVNRSRATSEAQCMQKIIAIQKRGDADAKASRGNVVGQGRALYAASRAQKELFEGECASHPQAGSYVSSGEAGMREWGDKCEQAGGGTDCSGSGSSRTDREPANTPRPEGNTRASSANSNIGTNATHVAPSANGCVRKEVTNNEIRLWNGCATRTDIAHQAENTLNAVYCLVNVTDPKGKPRECGGPNFAEWMNGGYGYSGAILDGYIEIHPHGTSLPVMRYGAQKIGLFACKHPYEPSNVRYEKGGFKGTCMKCGKWATDGKRTCLEPW